MRARLRCTERSALALTLVALACTTPSEPQQSPDGLVRVASGKPGTLFLHPDPRLGDYDDFLVSQVGIHYAAGQPPLAHEDEQRVYAMMIESLASEIEADDLEVVSEPGPCTLRVGLYLKDLAFQAPPNARRGESHGAVTAVLELRDSQSDEPLARYGQRRSLGRSAGEDPAVPDLQRLGRALAAIMVDADDNLTDALRTASGARERSCEGRIGRSARARR